MRYNLIIILVAAAWVSCKPVKKIQTIQTAIARKDTVQKIILTDIPDVDSVAVVKDIMGKVLNRRINFKTFSAKIKVDYEGPEQSQQVTAYLSMEKDKVIIAKLVGSVLGISKEGAEIRITPDSVTVVNKIDRTVQYRKITYLQQITEIPFDFYNLQDMIIGNPVFIDSNIVSYRNSNAQLRVMMVGSLFKHLLTLDTSDYKLLHSKLDDIDIQRNRTCDITFSNYRQENGFQFSAYRKISVAEKSQLDVYLDFKEYVFNDPLKYSFAVPKNYKKE